LSPFSATIVQISSNLRNDWNFATRGCNRTGRAELVGATGSKQREKARPVPHDWLPPFHAPE
jgi:hypothetical protein